LHVKTKVGAENWLYPLPTALVGATVDGKPNYITIAHLGITTFETVSLGMGKSHYTNAGIKENKTFSVNIPSERMVKDTDYCGLVSGRAADKASLFKTFYGMLKTAPMIEECPINMEFKLVKTIDFPRHDVFIGEVVETYCDEDILVNGVADFGKVKPILFVLNDKSYWRLGERLAKAWSVGKEPGIGAGGKKQSMD
jgi:flavin reductase (DIM6/NTAB) family NADH-FMN oxidoreductase RutF